MKASATYGSRNQSQCAQVRKRLSVPTRDRRARPRCRRTLGSRPKPIAAVGDDRVADPEAGAQALGVVVGQLVDHREGPHLQRVHGDVALARARIQDGQPERPGGAGRNGHRSGDARPAAQQRHGDRSADRRRRSGTHRLAQRRRWLSGPHEVGE